MSTLGRVGVIGRFKPLHNGQADLLERICSEATCVVIGIGSSNRYDARNPFTANETQEMLEATLSSQTNYIIIHIPDFAASPKHQDGQEWRMYVKDHMGTLDHMITGNKYVASLLGNDYHIIDPHEVLGADHDEVRATEVRLLMAKGGDWRSQVPTALADYILRNGLDARLRAEFSQDIIAYALGDGKPDSPETEKAKVHRGSIY
ncbi:MAG: hypothetical protein ABIH41_04805 [Nanoarchaeota archaeon]